MTMIKNPKDMSGEEIEAAVDELVSKVLAKALQGDRKAMKLLVQLYEIDLYADEEVVNDIKAKLED